MGGFFLSPYVGKHSHPVNLTFHITIYFPESSFGGKYYFLLLFIDKGLNNHFFIILLIKYKNRVGNNSTCC